MLVFTVAFRLIDAASSKASIAEGASLPTMVMADDVPGVVAKIADLHLAHYALRSVIQTPNKILS